MNMQIQEIDFLSPSIL